MIYSAWEIFFGILKNLTEIFCSDLAVHRKSKRKRRPDHDNSSEHMYYVRAYQEKAAVLSLLSPWLCFSDFYLS